jgi:glycosyltransferase involved in cell wall biosynthesis
MRPWLRNHLLADAGRQMARQAFKLGLSQERPGAAFGLALQRMCVKQGLFFEKHLLPRLRRSKPVTRPYGINVAGFFTGEYGIGDSSRALARAVKESGLPHRLVNIASRVHSNRDEAFHNFSGRNPYGVNLMTFSFDYARRFQRDMGRRFFNGRRNIALWYWELMKFPSRWHTAFDYYDEIWTVTEFCRAAFAEVSPVPVKKITYPFYAGEAAPDRGRFGIPEKAVVFLFNFDYCSLIERKNPGGLIEAFKRAFGNSREAVLVLKSINGGRVPEAREKIGGAIGGANVICLEEHLRAAEMRALFASADCYVSLHRAEGLGLGMAQAMAAGKPVIATGYSGNMEFMNGENSLPVDYRLVEIERDAGPYEKGNLWAEPDARHAAELMRRVFENRDAAAEIGRRAAQDVRKTLSPERTKREIMERLAAG